MNTRNRKLFAFLQKDLDAASVIDDTNAKIEDLNKHYKI